MTSVTVSVSPNSPQEKGHEVWKQVADIIENISESSKSIFDLLPKLESKALDVKESAETAKKPSVHTPAALVMKSNECTPRKKLKSVRQRNALRSASHRRMKVSGDYSSPSSSSSSLSDESLEFIDQKSIDPRRKRQCLGINDTSTKEPFFPYTTSSELSSESCIRLCRPEGEIKKDLDRISANVLSRERIRFDGSLSDGCLTVASSQNPIVEEEEEKDSLAAHQIHLIPHPSINSISKPFASEEVNEALSQRLVEEPEEEEVLNRYQIQSEILKNFKIITALGYEQCGQSECSSCSDRFLLCEGLEQHLQRKTLLIEYYCDICLKTLKFFNRCTLLQHVISHCEDVKVDDFVKHIKIKSLEENEYLHFEYASSSGDETVLNKRKNAPLEDSCSQRSSLGSGHNSISTCNSSSHVDSSVSHSLLISKTTEKITEDRDTITLVNMDATKSSKPRLLSLTMPKCCKKHFETEAEFIKHFSLQQKSEIQPEELIICSEDDIPCWSPCMKILHQQTFHNREGPLFCPECHTFYQDWLPFKKHLDEECLLLSQKIIYSCVLKSCDHHWDTSMKSKQEAIDHVRYEHCRAVILCTGCNSKAFATSEWFFKHLAEEHSITVPLDCKLDTKPDHLSLSLNLVDLPKDFEISSAERTVRRMCAYLIQCTVCNFVFPSKVAYDQHLLTKEDSHVQSWCGYSCKNCCKTFLKPEELKTHIDEWHANHVINSETSETETSKVDNDLSPETASTTSVEVKLNGCKSKQKKHPNSQPTRTQPRRGNVCTPVLSNDKKVTETSTSSKMESKNKNAKNSAKRKLSESQTNNEFIKSLKICQYCDRLLVEVALKRHEDQCSGKANNLEPGHCLVCKENLGDPATLACHGLDHSREGLVVCLFCNNRKLHIYSTAKTNSHEEESLKVLKNHIYHSHTLRAALPYECPLCDVKFEERKPIEKHFLAHQRSEIPITKSNSNILDEFNNNQSIRDESKATTVQQTITISTSEDAVVIFYCPICRGREFFHCDTFDRHMSTNHKLDLSTDDLNKLKKTSSAKRFLISKIRQPLPNPDSSKRLTSRPFGAQPALPRRKRASSFFNINLLEEGEVPAKKALDDVDSENIGHPLSSARADPGNYSCLKCKDFASNNEETFLNHVKSVHVWSEDEVRRLSLEGSERLEFWCPECNTTFVTKLALKRHMKVKHEFIQDLASYLKKIGYEGGIPILENQCEVCYQQFTASFEFQRHLRTHGMAFLRTELQKRKANDVKE